MFQLLFQKSKSKTLCRELIHMKSLLLEKLLIIKSVTVIVRKKPKNMKILN